MQNYEDFFRSFEDLGSTPSLSAQKEFLRSLQLAIRQGRLTSANANRVLIDKMQKVLVFSINSGGNSFNHWKRHWISSKNYAPKRGVRYSGSQWHYSTLPNPGLHQELPLVYDQGLAHKQSQGLVATRAQIKTPRDIVEQKFNFFKTGNFTDLLGEVTIPFSLMVSGEPGSGKTSFFLQLIKHVSEQYPSQKVLFISNEERFNPSMCGKLKRFALVHQSNIDIADALPNSQLLGYDFVFFDSVQSLKVSIDEFQRLIKDITHRGAVVFFVFQATKSGRFRGSLEYEHEVDISLQAKKGLISVIKNRFGGSGFYEAYNS